MRDRITVLFEFRGFLAEFIRQQLRQRYESSILGFLWTLLNPLLIYVCFCIVFSFINHWDIKNYGIYFFSGYMAWTFFSTAVLLASDSIVANAGYVTRVYVPKAVFPISSLAVSFVDLLASFLVLAIIMVVLGARFSKALLILPISALLLTVFVAGVCFLIAMWTVFLRDLRYLLNSLFFIWFFFCPILYRADTIPAHVRPYFELNPILPFIRLFQAPISAGTLPSGSDLIASATLAAVSLIGGAVLFFRAENRFYYYV